MKEYVVVAMDDIYDLGDQDRPGGRRCVVRECKYVTGLAEAKKIADKLKKGSPRYDYVYVETIAERVYNAQ